MKFAHVGPIASNAYLNAKQQRALGIEADCFDFGAGPAQWTPMWEDGDWDTTAHDFKPQDAIDWREITMLNGYERQPWAKIIGWSGGPAWFDALDDRYYAEVGKTGERGFKAPDYPHPNAKLRRDLKGYARADAVRAIADAYDLVVLYGPEAAYGSVLEPGTKYVTFECSTMRAVPELRDKTHRLLAASYRDARRNIITNADCIRSAEALGVADTSRFIPHPIDLPKFSIRGGGAPIRQALCDEMGVDLVFLAPARQQHANDPDAKGNTKILTAFLRYVQDSERDGAPKAGLLLLKWGSNVPGMEQLITDLDLWHRVRWVKPTHKARLIPLYDAVDVVLDQFSERVGSYGTTVVEALAMGKPVITHVNPDVHRWCEDVIALPPHHEALTSEQIWVWLTTLAHAPGAREKAGTAGEAWTREWCAASRIQTLNLRLYEDALA